MTNADLNQVLFDFRVLVAPGLHGSGPGHWQTRWLRLFPRFERVVQDDWGRPDLHIWGERVRCMLRQSCEPTLVVAHSFGCLASVRASLDAPNLAGALLVAPAEPLRFGLADRLLDLKLACPSIVVGSLNDPWMGARRASWWADTWGSEFINAGALGHINAESQLGDWQSGLALLGRLACTAASLRNTAGA